MQDSLLERTIYAMRPLLCVCGEAHTHAGVLLCFMQFVAGAAFVRCNARKQPGGRSVGHGCGAHLLFPRGRLPSDVGAFVFHIPLLPLSFLATKNQILKIRKRVRSGADLFQGDLTHLPCLLHSCYASSVRCVTLLSRLVRLW